MGINVPTALLLMLPYLLALLAVAGVVRSLEPPTFFDPAVSARPR